MQPLPLHLRSIEPGYLFSHNMSYFFLNSFIEISSTHHTIHLLKMYNSVVFRVFTATSNHLHSQFQRIFVTSERNVHSLGITAIAHPQPPPLSPGSHQSAVSIHVFASSGHFTKTNSYSKWSIVTDFSPLTKCFQNSFMFYHPSFFLWPNNIPLCGYPTFCLSIYQLTNIWIMLL